MMRNHRADTSLNFEKLKDYKVPELYVNFVDREVELKNLLNLEKGRVHIITGPKGCGKTELIKVFTYLLQDFEDYNITYIIHEVERGYTYLYSNNQVTLRQLIGKGVEIVEELLKPFGIVIKQFISLIDLIQRIFKVKKFRKVNNIIIIDEFRDVYKNVRQVIEIDANLIRDLDLKYSKEGGSIKLIYITSDATITYLRDVIGSKVDWYIVWNLPENAFTKLIKEISCEIESKLLWKLIGGNPRELIILRKYNWNLNMWISEKITTIRKVIENYVKSEKIELHELFKRIENHIDNIDDLSLEKIWDYFLEKNIVMEIDTRYLKLSYIPEEKYLGLRNAFQLPIYYHVLKAIIEYRTLNIKPEDVIKEID